MQNPSTSLGEFTATGALKSASCRLANVIFNPGTTTSAATLIDTGTGLILFKVINVAANSGPHVFTYSVPVCAPTGLTLSAISGTGSSVVVSIIQEG